MDAVTKDRIVLYPDRTANLWMARFEGERRKDIVALFDTDSIPTPFNLIATPKVVRMEIQRLNPQIDVVVEKEGD